MSTQPSKTQLIFVYNADSGLFNTMADIGHKIFSPSTYACDLCALTHGYFSERKAWRTFVESLPIDCIFLHKDEFQAQHPAVDVQYPVIFLKTEEQLKVCVSARSLADCKQLDDLQNLITLACEGLLPKQT